MTRILDRRDIENILPHRDPFLFVDEVHEMVAGEKVVGMVRVDDSEPYLNRDRAGRSYFPPTLLTEAMAQVGAVLVLYPEDNRGKTILFRSIEEVKFHRNAPAGTTLRVEGVVRRMKGRLGSLKMSAFLEDELIAEGVMGFALP